MRHPIRSETDAFYVAYGGAALIGASIGVGALLAPVAGVGVFTVGVVAFAAWELSQRDPERRRPLREAAAQGRSAAAAQATSRPRVLVVANRTLGSAELVQTLRERAAAGAELRVVVPIVTSRAHYIVSDIDRELAEARQRLAGALAWAEQERLDMTGRVGDPTVALGAIEDELRTFAADEVVISTYPSGSSNWLETGIIGRLRDELDIDVTHIVAGRYPAPLAPAG